MFYNKTFFSVPLTLNGGGSAAPGMKGIRPNTLMSSPEEGKRPELLTSSPIFISEAKH